MSYFFDGVTFFVVATGNFFFVHQCIIMHSDKTSCLLLILYLLMCRVLFTSILDFACAILYTHISRQYLNRLTFLLSRSFT